MKYITLTNGQQTLVDDEDYDFLMQWQWNLGSTGYVVRGEQVDGKYKSFLMHRILLDAPKHLTVDHINTNRLDNRRSNLRLCSIKQNSYNARPHSDNTTSIFEGVIYDKQRRQWRTEISGEFIGRFNNEYHAALAYDLWAKDMFGEYARTNFPLVSP